MPTATDEDAGIDARRAREIEERYESERRQRVVGPLVGWFVFLFLIVFAVYHYVTAGTGIPVDYWHMGFHLSGVLMLIFILYPATRRRRTAREAGPSLLRPGGVPLHDWALGIVGILAALWIGFTWEGVDVSLLGYQLKLPEQALRQGNPAPIDVVLGTALTVIVLEATRRTVGIVLPIIVLVFIAFALFGPSMPFNILKHPGVTWNQFINNAYFPSEGIFGISLWVVSTVVFHFVLFGAVAQKMGLGQLFVDVSKCIAGRYMGGPAKVSVVSSALFGTISGSAVANVVSTGSLTIPNMKRLGYPAHFAGGVEAASSAGGQVTPPIMGAAAFIMAEFLQMPYSKIAIAAAVPAFMHYLGVLTIVHFEAKRLGLKGEAPESIPRIGQVLKRGWPAAIPLLVLLYVLFSGYTPYMAAFWGITACVVIGLVNPMHRMSLRDVADAFYEGGRAALAVGAICAAVGIVIAVVTLTGLAFRLGFMVTGAATDVGRTLYGLVAWLPFELFTLKGATLFLSMVFIAIACILMGAGVPTTALYIMLVTVAQPAFTNLGVPPLATHLFVLYYGIISEVTPPVCTSAYAAAAIAKANPWKTGFAAFRLSNAKIMVPFVFCYSPALLLVLPGFTWMQFFQTALSCAAGVMLLGMAFTGFIVRPLAMRLRLLLGFAGLCLVHPGSTTDLIALAIAGPILAYEYLVARGRSAAVRPAE
jgi:TRAP transporter 4TM/12TM fusion protein